MADTKKYLDLNGLEYFYNKLKVLFSNIDSYLNFLKSSSTSETSLSNINVNTRLHVVNVSSNQTLSLVGGSSGGSVATAGRDVHIIIKNTSSETITVTMPTDSATNILVCESSYDVEAGKYLEVNVISDGASAYYRVAEQN